MSDQENAAIARLEEKLDGLSETVRSLNALLMGDGVKPGVAAKVETLWQSRMAAVGGLCFAVGALVTRLIEVAF